MSSAVCTTDGNIATACDFARLPPETINEILKWLDISSARNLLSSSKEMACRYLSFRSGTEDSAATTAAAAADDLNDTLIWETIFSLRYDLNARVRRYVKNAPHPSTVDRCALWRAELKRRHDVVGALRSSARSDAAAAVQSITDTASVETMFQIVLSAGICL